MTENECTDLRLQQLREALAGAAQGMTAAQLDHSQEGKWSVAEILEHLLLTYTGTMKGCERCLESGKVRAGKRSVMQQLRVALTVHLGYMPGGRKAPERSLPMGLEQQKVLDEIGPKLTAMNELLAQCETRFGRRTRLMDHPILGPLTAPQWRKFHWVHGCHHLKQIRALQRHLPRS